MRNLLYTSLGFSAGCALCVYLWLTAPVWPYVLLLAAVGGLLYFLRGTSQNAKALALILLGLSAAAAWFQCYRQFCLSTPASIDGKTEPVSIRTTDYSSKSAYGYRVDGSILLDGKSYRVRTYLDDGPDIAPGTLITGTFRFRLTTPEGSDNTPGFAGKGVFLIASQKGELQMDAQPLGWKDFPAVARHRILEVIGKCFPRDTVGFAKALVLGDTSGLGYAQDTALKVSGIRHIAAVSGLHVSILFAMISMVSFRKRFLSAILGLPCLLLFAALAGFSPSVNRACIMSGLMLLAQLFNREYDGPTALSFAVMVMLASNPLVIASVSFQLSVASVGGIFLFAPQIRSWISGKMGKATGKGVRAIVIRWLSGSISISLSSWILTAPLCAWYFGMVSIIGILTNLLTLWVVSTIFYGIAAASLLYFWLPSAGVWMGGAVSWLIRYVLAVSGFLAKFPLAAVYTDSTYIVLWLVFCYLLLIVFRLSGRRSPGVLVLCCTMTLCASVLMSWIVPRMDNTRVTVLDVGQGQCILLQSRGKYCMVDCGGDSDLAAADIAARALLSQGIRKLDVLILTHYDRDHIGGVEKFLSRIPTDMLVLPPEEAPFDTGLAGKTIYASENLSFRWDDCVMQVFAPDFSKSSNEFSLCVLFDTQKCDILITGDRNRRGEKTLLGSAELPRVDVLVAGHHGSATSTSEELLQTVKPEIVCISVGRDNHFGHPAPETLERLNASGCQIYRTDLNGTITIRR